MIQRFGEVAVHACIHTYLFGTLLHICCQSNNRKFVGELFLLFNLSDAFGGSHTVALGHVVVKEGHDKIAVGLVVPAIHCFQTVVGTLYLEPKPGKLLEQQFLCDRIIYK